MGTLITGGIYGDKVGETYVTALWFEQVDSGTSGTLTPPTQGEIVLDQWAAGVDALASTLASGIPTYISPATAGGVVITATLDSSGAYALSGTPSAYPVAVVYVYKVKLRFFDYTKQLGFELIPSAAGVFTDTGAFTHILSASDTTVQKALDTVDTATNNIATIDRARDWFFWGKGGGGAGTGSYVTMTAVLAKKLSDFAATSSAELITVISDETGTGALVFANSPTLIAPTLGAAKATSLNVGGNASTTESVEAAGALASTNYSGSWAAGNERAMLDFDSGSKFARLIGTGGASGTCNGIKVYPGSTETKHFLPTHTKELYPVCLTGSVQRFGINCYYDGSVWRLASGTAQRAAVITVDPDLGQIDLYGSEVDKNEGEEITLEWQASFGSAVAWFPRIQTTASGANAFLDSTSYNSLLRSTSSLKYKQDVQELSAHDAGIIAKLRPITFRSTCKSDDKSKRHFGFIAEEVAEIDTKAVNYHEGAPDGLQYDRLIVPLVAYCQRLERRITELETRS